VECVLTELRRPVLEQRTLKRLLVDDGVEQRPLSDADAELDADAGQLAEAAFGQDRHVRAAPGPRARPPKQNETTPWAFWNESFFH
jgi:hypothetical protein